MHVSFDIYWLTLLIQVEIFLFFFFIWQLIFSWKLDILSIMLWDSGFHLTFLFVYIN